MKRRVAENGPERDGGKKSTSGPRHRRAVSGRKKRPKMGSLVNFGCGPLWGLFYFAFSEIDSKRRGEMGSLEKLHGCEAQTRPTHCENAKTWSPSWRNSISPVYVYVYIYSETEDKREKITIERQRRKIKRE